MSTRGVFVFSDRATGAIDDGDAHCVYVHYDTYPKGAAAYLAECLASRMTWPAPRYEADEFAAGFVASIKAGMRERADARTALLAADGLQTGGLDRHAGGNVRLMRRWDEAADVEWAYLLKPAANGRELMVTVAPTSWDAARPFRIGLHPPTYEGTLAGFLAAHRQQAAAPGGEA
jgi:hypothetical protein